MAHLLATKLFVPRPRPDLVPRPRLLARLDAGLDRARCTLLSAPAGAGKTSLLAAWLASVPRPVAWLALDERDQDVHQFLRYLVAAIGAVAPDCGRTAGAWLDAPPPQPPPDAVLTSLLNDLAALATPCLLAIDDYHLVRAPAIHRALLFLLDHLPPTVHLVVATREDPPLPLPRLRARGQLSEIRAADLRFTPAEAATFLGPEMGLSLTDNQIDALVTRTEGWAAGLQLAALALRDRADSTAFVAAFAGGHRLVADYLTTEVLDLQPESTRRFLLATCLLDRFCAPLCDALFVAGSPDPGASSGLPTGESQQMLEALERANLFLVPLDDERRWYRYHHLFADALRARLAREAGPDAVAALHRRASAWFERQELLPEAIQHALAAGEGPLAARLIELVGHPMQQRGELATVMGWLAALPEDALQARPRLGVLQAWGLATSGHPVEAERRLAEIQQRLTAAGDLRSLLGEVTAIHARSALLQGRFMGAIDLAYQSLDNLADDETPLRAATNVTLGAAAFGAGDLPTASQSYTRARDLYLSLGQADQALLPLRQLARVQLAQGRLNDLERSTREAMRIASAWGERSPRAGYAYLTQGELSYERNDLAATRRAFDDGLALLELVGTHEVLNVMNLMDARLGLARIEHAEGDTPASLELVRQTEPIWGGLARTMQQRSRPEAPTTYERKDDPNRTHSGLVSLYADRISALQVRLWLSQGDVDTARRWTQTWNWNPEAAITIVEETRLITRARVLIAQEAYEQASVLLARLADASEAVGRMARVIEVLVLQAIAQHARGHETESTTALERALSLAEPEGFVRIFVDEGPRLATLLRKAQERDTTPSYVAALLAAFSRPAPEPASPVSVGPAPVGRTADGRQRRSDDSDSSLPEPLTAREHDVLRLLAAGRSNAEMARSLVVEQSTVKTHLLYLYAKLGVRSRGQAVARARELLLLD